MALTLKLPLELEAQVQQEAAASGADVTEYASDVFLNHLRQNGKNTKPLQEAVLSHKIRNATLEPSRQRRYRALASKQKNSALSSEEQNELFELIDKQDAVNVRWLEAVIALARLRGVAVEEVAREFKNSK